MSDSIEKIANEISHSLDVRAPKWAARLRAISSLRQVPEGYVLVPREPTKEMRSAGERARLSVPTNINPWFVWSAMIAAAPKANPAPPTSGDDAARAEFERQSAGWSIVTPWDELHEDVRQHWRDWTARHKKVTPAQAGAATQTCSTGQTTWYGPDAAGGYYVQAAVGWFYARPQEMLTPEQFAERARRGGS